nr:immunoglobulin light chain junction region [Mus musculus]
CQQFWGTPYTF